MEVSETKVTCSKKQDRVVIPYFTAYKSFYE